VDINLHRKNVTSDQQWSCLSCSATSHCQTESLRVNGFRQQLREYQPCVTWVSHKYTT